MRASSAVQKSGVQNRGNTVKEAGIPPAAQKNDQVLHRDWAVRCFLAWEEVHSSRDGYMNRTWPRHALYMHSLHGWQPVRSNASSRSAKSSTPATQFGFQGRKVLFLSAYIGARGIFPNLQSADAQIGSPGRILDGDEGRRAGWSVVTCGQVSARFRSSDATLRQN